MNAQSEGVPHEDGDEPFDAAAAQALIDQADGLRDHLEPDSRLLYGAWGLAWVLGYGTLALTQGVEQAPPPWAFVVFIACLVAAGALTAIHISRRSAGVRGASSRAGTLYGLAWPITFVAVGLLIGALSSAGLTEGQIAIAANGISTMAVGVLYLGGGAMYRDPWWFGLGAWIVLVSSVASMSGLPALFWIMSLAGGGGMLAVALVAAARTRSRSRGRP